jgi:hypothetical protein
MRRTTVHISVRDLDALYLAAKRQELSQAEFIREAVREKAARSLVDEGRAR